MGKELIQLNRNQQSYEEVSSIIADAHSRARIHERDVHPNEDIHEYLVSEILATPEHCDTNSELNNRPCLNKIFQGGNYSMAEKRIQLLRNYRQEFIENIDSDPKVINAAIIMMTANPETTTQDLILLNSLDEDCYGKANEIANEVFDLLFIDNFKKWLSTM